MAFDESQQLMEESTFIQEFTSYTSCNTIIIGRLFSIAASGTSSKAQPNDGLHEMRILDWENGTGRQFNLRLLKLSNAKGQAYKAN